MNLINPLLLVFAAAAGIPLLLHLFNRQRVKIVEFSTVKYLQSLQKTRMRKLKIRQILLLIVRTLIPLMVVLAFARPTTEGGYLPALGGKTTTTAIVMIDISASSATETNQGSFFEHGIERAQQLLDDFSEKEKVVILGFGSEIIYDSGKPSSDFDRQRQLLANMRPTSSEANPATVFNHAYQLLKQSSDPNLEIYLISDLQGKAWRDFEFNLFDVEKLDVKLFLLPTAVSGRDNASVTDLEFPRQIITAGRNFNLNANVTNHRSESSTDLLVSLELDSKKVSQTNISLPPGGKGSVSFAQAATRSGFLSGVVSIDDDDLMGDNSYYFALRVPSITRVIVFCDDKTDRFHLQSALAPVQSENLFKQISMVSKAEAGSVNLYDYDVAIVSFAGVLPSYLLSSLNAYLNAGGSVLFFLPAGVDIKSFSAKVTSPLFGLKLLQTPSQPRQTEGKYLLANFDLDHPIFTPYQKVPQEKQPAIEFYGHFKVLESAGTTVLARFSDRAPAIVEGTPGRGRALAFLFGLSEEYSDLRNHPLMVIMLNRSVEYLISEPLSQRERLIAGEEITRSAAVGSARRFTLVTPEDDSIQLSPRTREGEVAFNLGLLTTPGIYRILGDDATVDQFALNFPVSESELSYLQPQQMAEKLAGVKLTIISEEANLAAVIASARFGKELWKLFLLIAFVLLLIEMALASGGKQAEVSRN